MWPFGIFSPILVYCTKKNLATLRIFQIRAEFNINLKAAALINLRVMEAQTYYSVISVQNFCPTIVPEIIDVTVSLSLITSAGSDP
jgi:hypothetical protein